MITVTGATGNVGAEVVRQLAGRGQPLRALVRDRAKGEAVGAPGVELVVADMARPETLTAALRGTEKLFLLSPDIASDEKLALESNALEAAVAAGVRHVVYLSAVPLGREPGYAIARWHHTTEQRLERSGVAWTHVRPVAFMANLLMSADSIRADGAFHLPTGDGKVAAIDPRDIAAVAVQALTEPGHEGRAYQLTGPESLSSADEAARLSAALGRDVTFVSVPEEAAREAMSGHMSDEIRDAILEFYALVRTGQRDFVSGDFERVAGRSPRTFTEWAEDHAPAFA